MQLKVVFVLFIVSDECVCVCVGASVNSTLRFPITHNALPLAVTSLLRNDPHLPSRHWWCVYVTGASVRGGSSASAASLPQILLQMCY